MMQENLFKPYLKMPVFNKSVLKMPCSKKKIEGRMWEKENIHYNSGNRHVERINPPIV